METDPTLRVREALSQTESPFRIIWSLAGDPSVLWADNAQHWTKAFLCACLSELVYLRMSRNEVPGHDRYKVIPSAALRYLVEAGIPIDFDRLARGGDLPAATGETESLVFGVFSFPKFVIVAVRGTLPRLNDWLLDLDKRKVHDGGRRFHAGFYLDVTGALNDIVDAVPSDDRPVYFTGHSMGAAIAGILPQLWPRTRQRCMTPYTFAAPRFGDASVARFPTYAYVRAFDPVPHLPPRYSGFRSSGWPPTILPSTDKWLPGWKLMRHWRSLLPAHSMEFYRELVGQGYGGGHFSSAIYSKAFAQAFADLPPQPLI